MPESSVPSHENAKIPASSAVDFLIHSWNELGFDVSASAAAMIEALLPHVAPGDLPSIQALKPAIPKSASAVHDTAGLLFKAQPGASDPAIVKTPLVAKICKLCGKPGGYNCPACS